MSKKILTLALAFIFATTLFSGELVQKAKAAPNEVCIWTANVGGAFNDGSDLDNDVVYLYSTNPETGLYRRDNFGSPSDFDQGDHSCFSFNVSPEARYFHISNEDSNNHYTSDDWYLARYYITDASGNIIVNDDYDSNKSDSFESYICLSTDPCGSYTTARYTQSVERTPQEVSPVIRSGDPQDQRVMAGNSVVFTVSTSQGSNLDYQWKKNGVDISGATSSGYSFTAQTADNGSKFSVVVSNTGGQATSREATLTVDPPNTTNKPTAPQLIADGGAGQISLTWGIPDSNGGSPVTGYDLYRGQSSNSETFFQSLTGNRYTDTGLPDNTTYYYKVKAKNANGESPYSNEASATTSQPGQASPTIISQPADQLNKNSGDTASFSVTATGSGALTYEWQRGINGSSNFYIIEGATGSSLEFVVTADDAANNDTNANNFRARVTDSSNRHTTSNSAKLTVGSTGSTCDDPKANNNGEPSPCKFDPPKYNNPAGTGTVEELLSVITFWFYVFSIPILSLMILYGGFLIMTSGGEEERYSKGIKTIRWGIIGFIVLVLAAAIAATVRSILG